MSPTGLIGLFVRHPNAANLLAGLTIVIGLFSVTRLNTQFFPDFGIDFVSVTLVWPGASAEDVEANIVAAVEPAVRFLDSVEHVACDVAVFAGVRSEAAGWAEASHQGDVERAYREAEIETRVLRHVADLAAALCRLVTEHAYASAVGFEHA